MCRYKLPWLLPLDIVVAEYARHGLSADNACTKIEVLRDGKPLATLTEGIGSGKDVEYIDKSDNLTNGTHLYTVIPYNVYGEGPAAEAEVLVGARPDTNCHGSCPLI